MLFACMDVHAVSLDLPEAVLSEGQHVKSEVEPAEAWAHPLHSLLCDRVRSCTL